MKKKDFMKVFLDDDINKVDKCLKELGVTIIDEKGKYKSFQDVLAEVANKYRELED